MAQPSRQDRGAVAEGTYTKDRFTGTFSMSGLEIGQDTTGRRRCRERAAQWDVPIRGQAEPVRAQPLEIGWVTGLLLCERNG